ncbi:MAG: TetR family transcriptional regulator [Pseudomonadota bacterium]
MARPSKKAERREEIIDAYTRCVARVGVAGATVQSVADESGLARPLLHHFVGNRDDLLQALTDRLETRAQEEGRKLRHYLPESQRCAYLLEYLFDHRYATNAQDAQLYQALLFAANDHPALRPILLRWHAGIVEEIAAELALEHPQASTESINQVALGIAALYLNADSIAALAPATTIFNEAKLAAKRLLETL